MKSHPFYPSFRNHSLDHLANQVTDSLPADYSKEKSYRVNENGFRGENFNPAAKKHIYVFGCSVTMGIGLNEDEIWCHHLRKLYCEFHGLRPDEVNLLNFGIGGGSNQEISRNVMLQCSVKKPDLVVAQFSFPNRYEYLNDGRFAAVGPWTPSAQWESEDLREQSSAHYQFQGDEQGSLDLVRNILCTQHFLAASRIDYLCWAVFSPRKLTSPIRALVRLIDRKRFLWMEQALRRLAFRNEFHSEREPKAADGFHLGPTVHSVYAHLIWNRLLNRPLDRVTPATR